MKEFDYKLDYKKINFKDPKYRLWNELYERV